jgi:tripartite ATP-independent transporter DctM subunit
MVPEMARRGYGRPFAAALTAAGSTLANLIPPSLGLIIYAALASVSVGALFVATIVPGLMVAVALMMTVWIISRARGYGGDLPKTSGGERLRALLLAVPALILPVIIVGGVRFGAFTATEAGAIAMIYALFCGAFLYRKLTGRNLVEAVRDAVMDTVVIVIIIAAAAPFAWVLAFERVPQQIAAGLAVLVERPWLLMLAINVFLLIVGLFMEMIAAMVILVPILVPLIVMAGFDPVTFGLIIVMNLVIGALTPPLGVLIFTTARAGGAEQVATFRAVLPFLLAMLVVLMLVAFVPALTQAPVRWLGP